jgi:hypothetical protein
MQQRQVSSKHEPQSGLPAWMFEVDEFDDTEASAESNILEDLDIDLHLIFTIILWTILRPLSTCTRSIKKERHPLKFRPSHSYWGPAGVMALYAAILWMANLPNATWVFGIVIGTSVFQHLTARVFLRPSHTLHVILLGYSIFPLVPFALLDVLIRPSYIYVLAGEIFVVLWSTYVGYVSYIDTCGPPETHTRDKWPLLYYPILFMNVYLISLLPYTDD